MSDEFEVIEVTESRISVPGPQGRQRTVPGMPTSVKMRCVGCDKEFVANRATNGAAGTLMKLGGANTYHVSCPSGRRRGTVSIPRGEWGVGEPSARTRRSHKHTADGTFHDANSDGCLELPDDDSVMRW